MNINSIIVTGGFGFIGSALCRYLIKKTNYEIIIIDKMTYASDVNSLQTVINNNRVTFYKVSIGNRKKINKIFETHKPRLIFNLAAETHVDNSILNPTLFIKNNILETHAFFEEMLIYFQSIDQKNKIKFKILHVSTDEVYGDISIDNPPVDEKAPYNPSSPYSASKAASDFILKSYFRTFGLPAIISNSSNNYGPFQNKEKFIPVIIRNILRKKTIPLYGDGHQTREWLFVDDNCEALLKIIKNGIIGENYNIGSDERITNIELITKIVNVMYKKSVVNSLKVAEYLDFVPDRFGHDRRYAINSEKIKRYCQQKKD